jgi:hypothetical protein
VWDDAEPDDLPEDEHDIGEDGEDDVDLEARRAS